MLTRLSYARIRSLSYAASGHIEAEADTTTAVAARPVPLKGRDDGLKGECIVLSKINRAG
jgi:hypothetical protein